MVPFKSEAACLHKELIIVIEGELQLSPKFLADTNNSDRVRQGKSSILKGSLFGLETEVSKAICAYRDKAKPPDPLVPLPYGGVLALKLPKGNIPEVSDRPLIVCHSHGSEGCQGKDKNRVVLRMIWEPWCSTRTGVEHAPSACVSPFSPPCTCHLWTGDNPAEFLRS